ncbi:MAG: hypothetical protein M3422_09730 [Actinomycetota bacterium]|nr:hypothetical protein [Actinomycetota bacterium]
MNALLTRALDAAFDHPRGVGGRHGDDVDEVAAAGFTVETFAVWERRFSSPAVELVEARP